ncbi:tetratricopeptide repeat protein [Rubripirellula lacrimiformis]|uniref:tetratricopeptide repeat protein n=1 Tax=Rubripirellula lacrimiformis TaxID=1930273 RepID=UPI0011A505E4|nr:tetratricopeptide repeat protein [Rubripirellula lacrimiformis]
MTHDPFSEQSAVRFESSQPAGRVPRTSLWVTGGIITAFLFCLCAGLGTAVWFFAGQWDSSTPLADLPPREDSVSSSFGSDAEVFNQGLLESISQSEAERADQHFAADDAELPNLAAASDRDLQVRKFIQHAARSANEGGPIPFHRDMFIAAIAQSPETVGSLHWADRFAIKGWLDDYEPVPDETDQYIRIVNIHWDDNPILATVDVIFYSDENQADSQRWFLVHDDGKWQVYDWLSLEYGRRMSDEYAVYVAGETRLAEGLDLIINQLGDAQTAWDAGREDVALAAVKNCETTPTMPQDRSIVLLRIAYTWMYFGRYGDALKSLQKITDPDRRWGVWPMVALCHLNMGRDEMALQAANKVLDQSPNHPRSHWLLSIVHQQMDRMDLAADEAVLALAGCPRDQSLVDSLMSYQRQQDIPALLDAMRHSTSGTWTGLADWAAYDRSWADALVQAVDSRTDLDMPDGIRVMIDANQAWSKQEFGRAAELFLQVRSEATDRDIRRVASQDHADARVETSQFEELFRESEDPTATFSMLVHWCFEGDFYGDPEKLFSAIAAWDESASSSDEDERWLTGLRGWCHWQLIDAVTTKFSDDPNPDLAAVHAVAALEDLSAFGQWRQSVVESQAEADGMDGEDDDGDSDESLISAVDRSIASVRLSQGQWAEVLDQFPDDVLIQDRLLHGLRLGGAEAMQSALDSSDDESGPEIEFFRNRLRAELASQSGEMEAADRWFGKATEAVQDLDPEGYYGLHPSVLEQRADGLVVHRMLPSEVKIDEGGFADLVTRVVRRAARWGDSRSVQAWSGRAVPDSFDAEQLAEIRVRVAETRFANGDFETAASGLGGDPSSDSRWSQRIHRLRLQALLEADDFDAASELVKQTVNQAGDAMPQSDSADHRTPPREMALIALARQDTVELQRLLAEFPSDVVAEWMEGSLQRRWLVRMASKPELLPILNEYSYTVGSVMSESTGRLFMPQDHEFSERSISAALQSATAETFRMTALKPSDDSGDTAWMADSPSGQRFLIMNSTNNVWTTPQMSSGSGDAVMIAVLDQMPQANRRLFQVAAAMAGDEAVAFSWLDEGLSWWEGDLRDRIQWDDRVPVDPKVLHQSIQTRKRSPESAEQGSAAAEGSDQIAKLPSGSVVDLVETCMGATNRISADLIGVDLDQGRVMVRPHADGVIDPLIRKDVDYYTRIGLVQLATPDP